VPVWGRGLRLSAPAAAFMNAWQMHNQEYDCLHEGAVVHAMATVLPAALAAAEQRGGVSGAELIAAIAVGTDIAAGLGLASRAGFCFFRPGTAGGFGATAAGFTPNCPRWWPSQPPERNAGSTFSGSRPSLERIHSTNPTTAKNSGM